MDFLDPRVEKLIYSVSEFYKVFFYYIPLVSTDLPCLIFLVVNYVRWTRLARLFPVAVIILLFLMPARSISRTFSLSFTEHRHFTGGLVT